RQRTIDLHGYVPPRAWARTNVAVRGRSDQTNQAPEKHPPAPVRPPLGHPNVKTLDLRASVVETVRPAQERLGHVLHEPVGRDLLRDRLEDPGRGPFSLIGRQPARRPSLEHEPYWFGVDATRDGAHHTAELGPGSSVVLQRDGDDHSTRSRDRHPEDQALVAIELHSLPAVSGEPQVDAFQVARSVCLDSY